jgi:polyisoprenoid-binding protein YceI
MSKKVLIGIGVILVLAVAAVAAYILRPTAEASAPIEAVPVQVDQPQPEMEIGDETGSQSESMDSGDSDEASSEPQAEDTVGEAEEGAADLPQGVVVFTIVQEQSEVRFTLDELLRGNPKTVVGKTNQVAGEIAIDVENPANSQVGTILVNARTLVTDNDFRNRAINNEILDTGKFEFISFTPTGITNFPENPQIGDELSFQITGDLTIRDVTHQVTFDAIVVVNSETTLTGYASTEVARADYDLEIPEVPSVADVDEEVLLEIDFTATSQ